MASKVHVLRIGIWHGVEEEHTQIKVPSKLSASTKLHVFIDNSVLAIFVDDRFCFTHRFYAREADRPLATLTGQWRLADLRMFALDRIWPAEVRRGDRIAALLYTRQGTQYP